MKTQFERYMALRYLKGAEGWQKGRKFLRFITYLSIAGVAVGVATLLLAISIARGFGTEIEKKIVTFGAHVQVDSYRDAPLEDAISLQEKIEKFDEVVSVQPIVSEFVLIKGKGSGNIDGASIWGVKQAPTLLLEQITQGSFSFQPNENKLPGLVIGEALARLLGVKVGDKITLIAQSKEDENSSTASFSSGGLLGIPSPRTSLGIGKIKQFHVSGIYATGLPKFDEVFVFIDIKLARELLAYSDTQVSRFDIMLRDIKDSPEVAQAIELQLGLASKAGTSLRAQSVYQVEEGLFAWIDLQKQIIPLLLGVIVVVGAFNLIGMLLMLILEKTPEIGILQSMGASTKSIRKLFLWLGSLIGVVGVGTGSLLALCLALLQIYFQIIPLPVESYYMDSAPVELNIFDFFIVGLIAFLLCLIASYFPARVASKVDPIRTIRFKG